ncbi:MAG: DEAD/DEAH box helicase, partial [Gammaproteobacteria bacterium]|nr:DEAD/DEAH box helicase [Gammaproteobacteria bacterium]
MSAHLTDIPFSKLALADELKNALAQAGLEFCTPIQAATLPLLLNDKDCSGQAQTGTGKTLAFLLGTLQHLLNSNKKCLPGKPHALILAPTRELALQIHKDAELLTKNMAINNALIYGGKAYDQQKALFQEPVHILIGTPGRLIDFFK